jgi:oligopeptide transport system ATP-binding protein
MSAEQPKPLLTVENLATHFPVRQGVFSRVSAHVRALDGVSFTVPRGTTMSLVGESGSGKTTCGRSLLRLIEPTNGRVVFDGIDVTKLPKGQLRTLRKRMQLIFQDPFSSLNPRMTVQGMLGEVLRVHRIVPRGQRQARIEELLGLVGLPAEAASRYPHEFSGGQRQRIGVARALAAEPDLIVADEPVSALDVSIQAQILNLLEDLQRKLGLTYLFIGHDLSVIRHISDTVAVMYLGKIVETGSVDDIFDRPTHPYTKALLSAVPIPDPDDDRRRTVLTGDVPSPINPPSGCPFHPRCPEARPECKDVLQTLQPIAEGHAAACHVNAPGPNA